MKQESPYSEARNAFTGQTIRVRCSTRRPSQKVRIADVAELPAHAASTREYDFTLASNEPPLDPPLDVGVMESDRMWRRWTGPYGLEIRCRVRDALVRLHYGRDQNKIGFPDPATWIPMFDEDCGDDESDGMAVHPEAAEALCVPGAGCGRFWIQFELGKFLYPRMHDGDLRLLDPHITELATESFGEEFVQACFWG